MNPLTKRASRRIWLETEIVAGYLMLAGVIVWLGIDIAAQVAS